jgi:hypothetical protein
VLTCSWITGGSAACDTPGARLAIAISCDCARAAMAAVLKAMVVFDFISSVHVVFMLYMRLRTFDECTRVQKYMIFQ